MQGIASDVLCDAMLKMQKKRIVAHVHDEIIVEVPLNSDWYRIRRMMRTAPDWAPGLCLDGDAYTAVFYKKI